MARTATNAASRCGRRVRRRGAVVVEMALVLPLCLMLLLSIFDFARLIMMQQLLENAARAGARLAVTNTSTLQTANIQSCVTQALAGQSLSGMTIQVYQVNAANGTNLGAWTSTPLGSYVAVQVTGNFIPMLHSVSLIPNPLPLTYTAIMLCEAH
jgi:Flp pilus assembly protein TadG